MADILTTTRATKPGAYIGRIFRPTPSGLDAFARLPCLVGKGSRLQTVFNAAIKRSFRNAIGLTFSDTSPHIATLAYPALNDQTVATLYTSNGNSVSPTFWAFTASSPSLPLVYDQILIVPDVFDDNASYLIDYQSTSTTIMDELPFSDLREVRFIGDTENQSKYVENSNYNIPVSITAIVADIANANDTVRDFTPVVKTGGGTSTLVRSGTFTGDYNRIYSLDITAVGGGFIDGTVGITLGSGGNAVDAPSPFHSTEAPPASGLATGVTIAGTAPTMTLTVAASTFVPSDVGKNVALSEATTGSNNGVFAIVSYISGTQVTYTNASGVAEAFTGVVTVVRGQTVRFTIGSATGISAFLDPATSDVITLTLDDSSLSTSTSNLFTFTGLGTSLIEIDTTVDTNTNQFPEFAAVVETVTNPSVSLTVRDDSDYSALVNRNYIVQCTAAAGVSPVRTATFKWVGYGEETALQAVSTEGTFSIAEAASSNLNVTVENGIKVDMSFGTVQFIAGDKFTFTAKAPRKFITAKDSRDYTLSVNTSIAGLVPFQYVTNTPEGRFGTIYVAGPGGSLRLPGGVDLFVRNIGTTTAQNRYVAADEYTFSTIDSELIDWTLRARVTETINTTEFYTDVLGTVTNTVGATYIILGNVPTDVLYVKDTVTDTLLTATSIIGQPIIWFVTEPDNNISVKYEYSGAEPSPGSLYFVTANILRPTELYNTPILSLTYDEASRLLGPISTTNDLLVAAELALNDNGAPGIYTCQAIDSDNDGIISSVDINNAILATERNAKLTDVIVLNGNSSLSTAATSNERMNDPFERKERALWWGLPVGTAIGSTDAPGTIVFTAKKSLQVYGDNHAHGTRTLMANNRAVKTITLTDGTQTDITVDGSFIQAATAGKNASFADPGSTLLRQFISGFKSMNTYSEPEELQLQAASVLYVSNQGSTDSPIFRLEESVTVDTSSADNNEISVSINQKQYVTRTVRDQMDSKLIAIVPPSEQAGVAIVQTFLVQLLTDLVAKGIIAPYTDDSGNSRPLNAGLDIEIFRDTSDKTLYNFKYWWNARYPIKRLFGLYSVDKRLFSQT